MGLGPKLRHITWEMLHGLRKCNGGVPAVAQWVTTLTAAARGAVEAWVWGPTLCSGFKDQAVPQLHSCGSDSIPVPRAASVAMGGKKKWKSCSHFLTYFKAVHRKARAAGSPLLTNTRVLRKDVYENADTACLRGLVSPFLFCLLAFSQFW